jgi:hypothetical protein
MAFRIINAGIASLLVVFLGYGMIRLAHVDSDFGNAIGADRLVVKAQQSPIEQRVAYAHQILKARPIDGRAFRILAEVSMGSGQVETAMSLYRDALAWAPRDVPTRIALAEYALTHDKFDEAMEHLDAIMRVDLQMRDALLDAVLPFMYAPELRDAFIARMSMNPPWRGRVSSRLRHGPTAPAIGENILAAMADSGHPLTEVELQTRVDLLRRINQGEKARSLWLNDLSAEERQWEGTPFDGGFEIGKRLPGAYNWSWKDHSGASIDIVNFDAYEGQYSLLVQFSGRSMNWEGPEQVLRLSPGSYRIETAAKGLIDSERNLVWRLTCLKEKQLVAELVLPIDTARQWQLVTGTFDIPDACEEQALQLRHGAQHLFEQRINGDLLIDRVSITPLSE